MKTFIYSLTLFLVTSASFAELYKWKDKDGNVMYSDKPPFEGAEQLDPPHLTTTPAVKVVKKKPKPEDTGPTIEEDFRYSQFQITSPLNDEAIRSNPGNISVSFLVKPALNLRLGHFITIKIDGTVVRDKVKSSSGILLQNIDRGTHTITASLKDKNGQTLMSSNPVKMHLLRHSALHRKAN